MKILIITGGDKRHYYLCQRVNELFPNTEIEFFFNTKLNRGQRIRSKFFNLKFKKKLKYLRKIILNFIFRYFLIKVIREYGNEQDRFFGKYKKIFEKNINNSNLNIKDFEKLGISINSPEGINLVKKSNSDITIVMGSTIICDEVIKNSKKILNIHTGLSPYYRGGNTNFWPIYNLRPNFCGFTIHLMTSGIDSGPIIYSDYIDGREFDLSYPKINNYCIKKAVEVLPEIIKNVKNLNPTEQWMKGKIFKNIDFDGYACFKYYLIRKRFNKNKNSINFDISIPKKVR